MEERIKKKLEQLEHQSDLIDKYTKLLKEKNIWLFNPGSTEWLPGSKESIKKAIMKSYFLLKKQGKVSKEDRISHFGAYVELASFLDNKDDVNYARGIFKEIENKNGYKHLAESIDQNKLLKLNDNKYELLYMSILEAKSYLSSEFFKKEKKGK